VLYQLSYRGFCLVWRAFSVGLPSWQAALWGLPAFFYPLDLDFVFSSEKGVNCRHDKPTDEDMAKVHQYTR